MAENVSWIKKPSTMLSRRTIHMKDLADINSTINMLNSNQADIAFRPPKRKSCMAFKERKLVQVPSEKKIKPNERTTTEFRNRTLKMVEQRLSLARPALLRPRSQLPCPKPTLARLKASPLHMSTPCEPPRSILKANKNDIIMSIAKKVNFDQVEPGVCPLQESTIQDFTQYDLKKFGSVTKVDASTNTDDINSHGCECKSFLAKMDLMMVESVEIKKLLNYMLSIMETNSSKNNGPCQTPSLSTPNQSQQFLHKLYNINEDNESETQEESTQGKETAETHVKPEAEEIKSTSIGFSKLSDVQEESCSSTENTVHKATEKVAEIIEEPLVHQAVNNLMKTEESWEEVTSSDTEHKKQTSKLQVSSPIRLKLRNLRKRNIPRHLQSFELSPKPKRGSQKE